MNAWNDPGAAAVGVINRGEESLPTAGVMVAGETVFPRN